MIVNFDNSFLCHGFLCADKFSCNQFLVFKKTEHYIMIDTFEHLWHFVLVVKQRNSEGENVKDPEEESLIFLKPWSSA